MALGEIKLEDNNGSGRERSADTKDSEGEVLRGAIRSRNVYTSGGGEGNRSRQSV
jgi:hypothetical protein